MAALGATAVTGTTSAVAAQFPLRHSTRWQQSARHMRAEALLTARGQLQADIRTWSTWKFRGFTGGCIVLVVDAHENIIYDWLVWPLGVDGTWTGKRSSRSDQRRTQVPSDVVARAASIRVACSHMPKDRFKDIVDELKDKAEHVVKAVSGYNGN